MMRALNHRAFDTLALLLAPDAIHIDSQYAVIEGRDAIVRAFRRLMGLVPDWHLRLDEVLVNDRVVMARGHVVSELPEIATEGLWTLVLSGGRVVEIHEMRRPRDGAHLVMVDPDHPTLLPAAFGSSKLLRRIH